MQLATAGTTNAASMLRPASSGSVQSLARASVAVFAWMVQTPGSPELGFDYQGERQYPVHE